MIVEHEHEHVHDDHITSRHSQPQQSVGALSQSHPGICGTLVGPGKDTHDTPVPLRRKAVGGPTKEHHATRPRQRRDQGYSATFLATNMVAEQRNDPTADKVLNHPDDSAEKGTHHSREDQSAHLEREQAHQDAAESVH